MSVIEQLHVREPILDQQICSQAADYAYHASLVAEANYAAKTAKLHAEVTRAQLSNAARENLAKPAEWAVTATVESDPLYIQAWENYHARQLELDLLIATKEGFAQRKDMLVTIASDLRQQRRGEVRVSN
jgi:hypothetical protein